MIADMPSNKKRNLIVTGLFIRGKKLNISLVFTAQSYSLFLKILALFCYENSKQRRTSENFS